MSYGSTISRGLTPFRLVRKHLALTLPLLLLLSSAMVTAGPLPANAVSCRDTETVTASETSADNVHGGRGSIEVNSDLSGNFGAIARGVGVRIIDNGGNLLGYVYVGWIALPGHSTATPAMTWTAAGAAIYAWDDHNTIYLSGTHLAQGSKDTYKITSPDHDGYWKGYINGTLIGTTPNGVANMLHGPIQHASVQDWVSFGGCNSGWAHWFALKSCGNTCTSWNDWTHPICTNDQNPDYHLEKNSDNELYVRTGQSADACAGATGF